MTAILCVIRSDECGVYATQKLRDKRYWNTIAFDLWTLLSSL